MSRLRDQFVPLAKRSAARLNLEVTRLDLAHSARRATAMRTAEIDVVLDVGANVGQYVDRLRASNYPGRIVSFEPIPHVFKELRRRCGADPRWSGVGAAVGAEVGTARLNVSADTVTSSVLAPAESLLDRIDTARSVSSIDVPVTTIDTFWDTSIDSHARVMLKIDVQGYEHAVLDGAVSHLDRVALIEVEMGLVELYGGGSTVYDMLPRLHLAGFRVVSFDSGFVDNSTGQVLDIDMLLAREPGTGSDPPVASAASEQR